MANPTVTDPDPLPGDFSTDRERDRRTVVTFLHTRTTAGTRPVIAAKVGSQYLLVYDGTGFVPLFNGESVVAQDGDEFSFGIIPAGGWWGEVDFFGWDGVAWQGQVGVGTDAEEDN